MYHNLKRKCKIHNFDMLYKGSMIYPNFVEHGYECDYGNSKGKCFQRYLIRVMHSNCGKWGDYVIDEHSITPPEEQEGIRWSWRPPKKS